MIPIILTYAFYGFFEELYQFWLFSLFLCCCSGYRRNKWVPKHCQMQQFCKKRVAFSDRTERVLKFLTMTVLPVRSIHVSAVFLVVHYTIQCILFCTQWGWKVTFCSIGTWFSKPFSLLVKRNMDWFARKSDIVRFLFAPSLPNARFVGHFFGAIATNLAVLSTVCLFLCEERLKITCTLSSQTEDHIEGEVLWMICDSDVVMICAEIVGIGALYQWFSSCGCSGPTIALSH